jgi:hypothetical protein
MVAAELRYRLVAAGAAAVTAMAVFALVWLGGQTSNPTAVYLGMAAILGLVPLALRLSKGWTLAIILLYLGLLDGFLRNTTGVSSLTLGRDVLLYVLVAVSLAQLAVRHQRVELPPLGVWVIAFVAIVLVQLLNPRSTGLAYSLAALRPHLEWVPLFFFGYVAVRTVRRLELFLALLLVVAAANGVVSFLQFQLSPDELAQWGPGYERLVYGTGDVTARVFGETDDLKVRPMGLGGDLGFGGVTGFIGLVAGAALLFMRPRKVAVQAGILALAALALAGVIASQARVTIIGAVVAVAALGLIAVDRRRFVPLLMAATIALLGLPVLAGALEQQFGSDAFRYESIAPDKIVSTIVEERAPTYEVLPDYVRDFPLGAGIGTTGPALSFPGGDREPLNGESQYNVLVLELGIVGALLVIGFHLRLIWLGARGVRRRRDPAERFAVAALVAPLVAAVVLWTVGPTTTAPPFAPFTWFAAGGIAWWCVTRLREDEAAQLASSPRSRARASSAAAASRDRRSTS